MKFQCEYYCCLFKAINGVPQYIVNSILVGHEGCKLDNYQTDEHYLTVIVISPALLRKLLDSSVLLPLGYLWSPFKLCDK